MFFLLQFCSSLCFLLFFLIFVIFKIDTVTNKLFLTYIMCLMVGNKITRGKKGIQIYIPIWLKWIFLLFFFTSRISHCTATIKPCFRWTARYATSSVVLHTWAEWSTHHWTQSSSPGEHSAATAIANHFRYAMGDVCGWWGAKWDAGESQYACRGCLITLSPSDIARKAIWI